MQRTPRGSGTARWTAAQRGEVRVGSEGERRGCRGGGYRGRAACLRRRASLRGGGGTACGFKASLLLPCLPVEPLCTRPSDSPHAAITSCKPSHPTTTHPPQTATAPCTGCSRPGHDLQDARRRLRRGRPARRRRRDVGRHAAGPGRDGPARAPLAADVAAPLAVGSVHLAVRKRERESRLRTWQCSIFTCVRAAVPLLHVAGLFCNLLRIAEG